MSRLAEQVPRTNCCHYIKVGPSGRTSLYLQVERNNVFLCIVRETEKDCFNTYAYESVTCNEGHELYRYTQVCGPEDDSLHCTANIYNQASSCSTCTCHGYNGSEYYHYEPFSEYYNTGPQCCNGWNGTQCDICQTLSACPVLGGNGSEIKPVACTKDSVVPANVSWFIEHLPPAPQSPFDIIRSPFNSMKKQ